MRDKLKNTDLRAALASAEKELQEILGRAEHLREWITVTKKLCAKRGKNSISDESPIVPGTRRTKASLLAAHVIEVLQAGGKPMHVEHIVAELSRAGHPVTAKNPKAAVAVALSRRPEQFLKTAPNTFGLTSATPTKAAVTLAS
jgi:hypothetical protein